MMRSVVGAWLCALLAAGAIVATALYAYPIQQRKLLARYHGEVVAIGTSLTGYAIPPEGRGLLGDDRRHVRLAGSRMNEAEALDLCEAAVALDGTKAILIEAYPFVRDFRDEAMAIAARRGLEAQAVALAELGQRWRAAVENLLARGQLGPNSFAKLVAERPVDKPSRIRPEVIERLYPLSIRSPRLEARLTACVSAAKARRIEVVLVAPPRSASAEEGIGTDGNAALDAALTALAARLDVSLFAPRGPWPDSDFVDHAHLNRVGRERFLAELHDFAGGRDAG